MSKPLGPICSRVHEDMKRTPEVEAFDRVSEELETLLSHLFEVKARRAQALKNMKQAWFAKRGGCDGCTSRCMELCLETEAHDALMDAIAKAKGETANE